MILPTNRTNDLSFFCTLPFDIIVSICRTSDSAVRASKNPSPSDILLPIPTPCASELTQDYSRKLATPLNPPLGEPATSRVRVQMDAVKETLRLVEASLAAGHAQAEQNRRADAAAIEREHNRPTNRQGG